MAATIKFDPLKSVDMKKNIKAAFQNAVTERHVSQVLGMNDGLSRELPWLFGFNEYFNNPASATASDLITWTSNDDGGTGTNNYPDLHGGGYDVPTAAADNDYHAMSHPAETFLFTANCPLWFEACFVLTEAATNDSAYWFGLTDTLTTGGFQANALGPLASYDGALIWKDEETLTLDFETSNAGTQATTTAMATVTSGTACRVGFFFDGAATTSTITPYYNVSGTNLSQLTAGTSQQITLSGLAEMHAVFGVKAGPAGNAETLRMRWVKCWQVHPLAIA